MKYPEGLFSGTRGIFFVANMLIIWYNFVKEKRVIF